MFPLKPRSVLLLMILLFLCSEVTAQVNCVPTYLKEYTGTGDMMPYAIRSLGDGTFIVAGKGMLNATSTYDGMVVKLAGDGTVLWSYYIGGPGQDVFTGITPLSDGGFLLYGTTTSFGYSNEKTWLVRIDNMGVMIWSRQLGNNTPGNDRIKAVQQFSDGDLIGTLNTDDSTAASNPVVFKMALDGTLVWARVFDHGNNDSFLSIAFDGNVIYAGGFYTVNTHRGVLVKMNSADGSLISSINILKKDNSFNHEVVGLEVYNNIISYGLWMWRSAVVTSSNLNSIIMAQTDMNDRTRFAISCDFAGDTLLAYVKRASDNGMLFIRPTYNYGGPPFVAKVSQFGAYAEWKSMFTNSLATITSYGLDITADGGCISAGFLKSFPNPYNRMSIMRMNANGITGNCLYRSNGLFTDTATYVQQPFTWAVQTAYTPAVNTFAMPTEVPFNQTSNTLCNLTLCTDVTPLPPACNKTYHLQYSSVRSTTLRDAVTTPDGGKLAIGDQLTDGLVMKINANGDIAWSKQYETFFSETKFKRVLRLNDGNYLIFANRYITLNHYASTYVSMIKMDINGNVIWTRDINYIIGSQIGDVVEAPDGGFVLLLNNYNGGGSSYSYVIRYDANINPLWEKEIKYNALSPHYASGSCSNNAVLLAYDSYNGSVMQTFGIDKLDLASGNRIWSKWYSAGSIEAIHVNRIFAMNDTAYLFLTHSIPTGSFTVKTSPVLLTLKPDGSMIRNILFQGDNIAASSAYNNYSDAYLPTVTLTPYNDFVLTNSVSVGADTVLNISRIDKNGNVAWSKNYPGTIRYFPFNIQSQGKGMCVMGNYRDNVLQNMYYNNNMFLIKTDSIGQIALGGGACDQVDRPMTAAAISLSELPNRIDAVVPFQDFAESPGAVTSADFAVDATLLCNTPANCNIVSAIPKGGGCSLTDTLTYLLDDKADCYAAVTWKFDPAFFKLVNMNGDSIRVVPQKTGLFTINARIEGSCISTTQQITASIGISASQVTLGNDALICTGQQIKLSAGPGYASYKWNDNSTDSTLIVTQPGKYYVDVTDNCGGTGTDTLLVNDAGLVFKITGNTTKCNNDTVQLQASGGYYNYQWTPQVNLQATNNTALVSPATTTKYYATAEKWPGCQLTDSILITTLTSPPVNLPNDVSICAGDSVMVQAAPGFNIYQWNTGETQSGIVVKSAGTFTIAATYTNGCQSKDTFRLLSLYPLPVPTLDKSPVLCTGGTRVLQPKQLYNSYLWSDGSIDQSMEVNTTGTYWVAVTDGHGCKGADTARITTIAPAPANFLPVDTAICQYAKLTIVPKYNYRSYLWSDFSNSSSLTVQKSGFYWLTVTDENNCTGSDTIAIAGKDCMEGLFIPNAFTPNGDGKNDVFRPLIFGNVTSFTFAIYNRWGGLVYETHDPAGGWNGKINGLSAQKGTYVWFCRYTLEGQPEKTEKGIVELVQ